MFYSIVTEAFEICIEFWDDEIKKEIIKKFEINNLFPKYRYNVRSVYILIYLFKALDCDLLFTENIYTQACTTVDLRVALEI